jgi:ribonucleoside-triphosphate reductase (thioredoxin)
LDVPVVDLSSQILSDITIFSKYARYDASLGRRETWDEIVDRYEAMHVRRFPRLAGEIRKCGSMIRDKKILPSMRALQFAGRPIELNPSRAYNCSYVAVDHWSTFAEVMFLLLGGTGVGYSVQYQHVDKLGELYGPSKTRRYLIGDSLEGWADAVKVLTKAYFTGCPIPDFDFGDIRPKGAPLKTAGGKAPGPEPLKDCLHNIQKVLARNVGRKLRPLDVHDIMCYIADAVLAGGIRRSAMIALFSWDDEDMRTCKFGKWWELNPQRARANNSAVAVRHRVKRSDFTSLLDHVRESNAGEPGVYFTNNQNWGTNPCGEIALRDKQFCNLCEINAATVVDQADLNARARAAAFFGTLQASYTDFHYLREGWKRTTEKEALLGIGMTGIAAGRVLPLDLIEAAAIALVENARVAAAIGINPAARSTCLKPAGDSSCALGGVSSGIHAYHSAFTVRRMRFNKVEAIYQYLLREHPELCEDDYFKPHVDGIVSIPMRAPAGAITREEETALGLLDRVHRFNTEWVRAGHRSGDNTHNVSVTVSVRENEWGDVTDWMWSHRDSFNGITLLPFDGHSYKQAPFEAISEHEYHRLAQSLRDIDLTKVVEGEDQTVRQQTVACAGGACEL